MEMRKINRTIIFLTAFFLSTGQIFNLDPLTAQEIYSQPGASSDFNNTKEHCKNHLKTDKQVRSQDCCPTKKSIKKQKKNNSSSLPCRFCPYGSGNTAVFLRTGIQDEDIKPHLLFRDIPGVSQIDQLLFSSDLNNLRKSNINASLYGSNYVYLELQKFII